MGDMKNAGEVSEDRMSCRATVVEKTKDAFESMYESRHEFTGEEAQNIAFSKGQRSSFVQSLMIEEKQVRRI